MKKMLLLVIMLVSILCTVAYAQKPIKKIGIGLYINDITDIHAKNEIIELEATLFRQWQSDKRPNKTQYIYDAKVDQALENMWWPYVHFLHVRSAPIATFKAMKILPNGLTTLEIRYSLSIESFMDMRNFPFDSQKLLIEVSRFGDSPYDLFYYKIDEKSGANLSPAAQHVEWDIKELYTDIDNTKTPSFFRATLVYERHSEYYIYKIFIPLFFILLIAYLIYWLPNQPSINRLTLLMTAMLTTVAFQWVVSSNTPKVPYMTLAQFFITFCYAVIALEACVLIISESVKEQMKQKILFWGKVMYPILVLGVIFGILLMSF